MNPTVLSVRPLGFPWETSDPFLFCVHHDDAYPAGNERARRGARAGAADAEGRFRFAASLQAMRAGKDGAPREEP